MLPPAASLAAGELAAAPALTMDESAFRLFYNRTARPLRAFLCATLHDSSLADDLLQETYMRFLQAELPPGAGDSHLKNYLFRIAANLMRDHFRAARPATLSDLPAAGDLAGDIARREDLHRIMKELNPRQRQLLWLAYVEQFSHGEIASMIGTKAASIRPMLARARQSLASLLRRQTGGLK
jgi:RNA polymerase sigma-70 factor (ECF subfamily)